ncbi:MAG: ArsA family ATPase, partial [Candidatus Methylomirabilis sp.]|nr:ArsA family ATPase [Deltaproteobacteria bacterium]
ARRLAQALGLDAFSHEATPVEVPDAAGSLDALMLDTKSTFDALIGRLAPSEESRDRILANTLYKNLSSALAGSHEYMAMEQLYAFHAEGKYDLLVLDTPPTHHALDFLDAPKRLLDFLSEDVLQWFVRPYFAGAARGGIKFLEGATRTALSTLEKVTGLEALRDVSDFFRGFSGMYDGFKDRARKVSELLTGPEAAYILVTAPAPVTVEEARYFYGKLKEYKIKPEAVILNRMHEPYAGPEALPEPAGEDEAARLARRLLRNLAEMRGAAAVDLAHAERLLAEVGAETAVRRVPLFWNEVLDLRALRAIHPYLLAE